MLNQQHAGLRCTASVSFLHKVYEARVPPVANYGCELWGCVSGLPATLATEKRKLGQAHVTILRRMTGLRRSTPWANVLSKTDPRPCETLISLLI